MLENKFDIYEPEIGHFDRFNQKLDRKFKRPGFLYWSYGIAAGFLLLLGMGIFSQNQSQTNLASISPELKQTQDFFEGSIQYELKRLEKIQTPESKKIVDEGISKLEKMEEDYQKLQTELAKVGYNKTLINAMIQNYQQRIEVLQLIIENIEQTKHLNLNNHENSSI